jgi:hypothetical protein
VIEHILAERQEQYGDATENFTKIGLMWSLILDKKIVIEPEQVAQMMIALKLVRLSANSEHEDSWLDIEGYAKHGLAIINPTDN